MFSDAMINVKRVRTQNLPHGPSWRLSRAGAWVAKDSPHAWVIYPCERHYDDGVFRHDMTIRGYERSTTGDLPRKYRSKKSFGALPGGRSLSLWQYIPFFRHKFRVDYEQNAHPVQGRHLPCQPSDSTPMYCYCTSENKWISRLPNDLPLVDEGVFYYSFPFDFTELGPAAMLEQADGVNLSLLAKRGIAALESALSNFPDMLVIFGELRELPDLVKLPHSVGDVYLNNQFGIVPTVRSIKDIIVGALHRWNDAFSPKKLIVRQYEKEETEITEGSIPLRSSCCWGPDEPCLHGSRNKTTVDRSMRFTLELVYQFAPPDVGVAILDKLTTVLSQLNLLGDASTIWELIPMSWAVDWFVDIGLLLKTLSMLTGVGKWASLSILDGYVAAQVVREERRVSALYDCQFGRGTATIREEAYGRVPLKDPFSWLTSTAMTPNFRLPHNMSQLLITLAMATK